MAHSWNPRNCHWILHLRHSDTVLGAAGIWCMLEPFQMHFMVSLQFDTLCSAIPAASIRMEAGPAGSAAAAQKRLWPNPADHCQQP